MSDPATGRSIAVIVASTLGANALERKMSGVPGYIAILESEGGSSPTLSYEAFPEDTSILFNGHPVDSKSKIDGAVDFEWRAPGFGYASEDEISIEIPGRARVDARLFGARQPWSAMDTDFGPQGLAALFSFLPLHWYVHSRATETEYKFTNFEGAAPTVATGRAWTHFEKNFGQAFPSAWMWLQGTSQDGRAHVALAGGELRFDRLKMQMTTYMIGYRSETVEALFRPSEIETAFYTSIDPCGGSFKMRATNLEYELILEAKTDPKTFGSVSIPTRDGYVRNGGRESFSTKITVEVYRNNWAAQFLKDRLIERREFENSALEFGAAYQDCRRGAPLSGNFKTNQYLKMKPAIGNSIK
jgi:hypothetical protein